MNQAHAQTVCVCEPVMRQWQWHI